MSFNFSPDPPFAPGTTVDSTPVLQSLIQAKNAINDHASGAANPHTISASGAYGGGIETAAITGITLPATGATHLWTMLDRIAAALSMALKGTGGVAPLAGDWATLADAIPLGGGVSEASSGSIALRLVRRDLNAAIGLGSLDIGGATATTNGQAQLRVQATPAQTLPIFRLNNGAGASVFSVDPVTGNATGTFVGALTGNASTATSATSLSGVNDLAHGGTGGTSAATARASLSAAVSGANADITSLVASFTAAISAQQGGTGLQSPAAGSLLMTNGSSPMAMLAPGASGNVLQSNGAAWIVGMIGAASIPDGTLPMAKELEARTIANVASTTLTVTAVSLLDASAHFLGPANGTVADGTISMTSSIPASNSIWTYIYRGVDGTIGKKDGIASSSPAPPNPDNLTIPSSFVWSPSGCTGYYQTQAAYIAAGSPANKGYVVDARTPYLLSLASAAGAGVTYPVPISLGGTEATSAAQALDKLGAAARGINSDIASLTNVNLILTAPKRIGALYFGTVGNVAVNADPTNDTWLRAASFDGKRSLSSGYFYSSTLITMTGARALSWYLQSDNQTANLTYLGGPYGMAITGDSNVGTIGAPSAPAYGSASSHETYIEVTNAWDQQNEHCPIVSILRYGNAASLKADGTSNSGNIGRGWSADIHLLGAIGVQQSALSGLHVTPRNYFNGSPAGVFGGAMGTMGAVYYDPTATPTAGSNTNNASAAFVASTMYGLGLGGADAHDTATTFPVDIGFLAIGSSGPTGNPIATQGFRYGFVSGGWGGNYGGAITGSRTGTGFFSRDHENYAVRVWATYPGSVAMGIVAHRNAGPSVFGTPNAGVTSASYKGYLNVGAPPNNGTGWSNNFNVNGGPLGSAGGSTVIVADYSVADPLANFPTVAAVDTANLQLLAVRNGTAGTPSSATTSFGFSFANATGVASGAALWFTGGGNIGVGATNSSPAFGLDVDASVKTIFRGDMVEGSNGTAVAIVNGATIPIANNVYNIQPASAVTGIIVSTTGVVDSQKIEIVNVGSFTATMAAAATSHVVTGTACVVPALGVKILRYNAQGGFWYPV